MSEKTLQQLKKEKDDAERLAEAKSAAYAKAMMEKAGGELNIAINALLTYKEFITPEDRVQILDILGQKPQAVPKKTQGRGIIDVPKYRLPDGTTWNGRGRGAPKAFVDFLKSPAGRAWKKDNKTGFDYPLNPKWSKTNAPSPKPTTNKATKKKTTQKASKKAPAKKTKKK